MKAVDVIVCGGGAAGMAAAIAAARTGARAILLESQPQLGGTVAHALIHTLGGLYDSAGEILNEGLALELIGLLQQADQDVRPRRLGRTWVLNVAPETYAAVTRQWIESEPDIEVLCGARVVEAPRDGDAVTQLSVATADGLLQIETQAVIDATGTAEVVRLIDPGLIDDAASAAAAGLIVRISGVERSALQFPRSLGIVKSLRAAAAEGRLPKDCDKAWLDQGVRANEAYLKFFVPYPAAHRTPQIQTEILQHALDMKTETVRFLQTMPEFAGAVVDRTGQLGVRDGGRIRGEYQLTGDDVRSLRTFSDAACRCSWPIEYWDSANGLYLEYLPDQSFYEIPLRSLRVEGFVNVWAAGKCLAADPIAQASARVVGTCWSMGEAVGKAAVCHAGTRA